MKLKGPDRFCIDIPPGEPEGFSISDVQGNARFLGRAASQPPKLYVVSTKHILVYVGITKQSMRARLRSGMSANGADGYHGYRWRHEYAKVTLDVWYAGEQDDMQDLETVEGEVVYLIRNRRQWPKGQAEIHFHRSTQEHRRIASAVLAHYAGNLKRKS